MKRESICRIYIDKKLSNGNTGRTKHWSQAHRTRDEWRRKVADCWGQMPNGVEAHGDDLIECAFSHIPANAKVGIEITRHLGKGERLWDPDSILRGSAKELLDSIVEAGYIKDDSARYVAWVIGLQDDSDRVAGPFTSVEFFEVIDE